MENRNAKSFPSPLGDLSRFARGRWRSLLSLGLSRSRRIIVQARQNSTPIGVIEAAASSIYEIARRATFSLHSRSRIDHRDVAHDAMQHAARSGFPFREFHQARARAYFSSVVRNVIIDELRAARAAKRNESLSVGLGESSHEVKQCASHVDDIDSRDEIDYWLNTFDLSRRESRILENLAKGMTPKEIADEFGVEAGTLRTALSRMRSRLRPQMRTRELFLENESGGWERTTRKGGLGAKQPARTAS